jgi:hypothetical protein
LRFVADEQLSSQPWKCPGGSNASKYWAWRHTDDSMIARINFLRESIFCVNQFSA